MERIRSREFGLVLLSATATFVAVLLFAALISLLASVWLMPTVPLT